jgi:hypothetical protein
MALETGTYVNDLVITNPPSGDPKSQGDDHLRLIKTVLKNTFPVSEAAIYPLRSATVQATTSGTAIDFTSIPSWVKKITVGFYEISTNGTSPILLQIGDSGGVETTLYAGAGVNAISALASAGVSNSAGFVVCGAVTAASFMSGIATLMLVDPTSFSWVYSVSGGLTGTANALTGGGAKTLSATLDRLRLTTEGGVNTFDNGVINIMYEG